MRPVKWSRKHQDAGCCKYLGWLWNCTLRKENNGDLDCAFDSIHRDLKGGERGKARQQPHTRRKRRPASALTWVSTLINTATEENGKAHIILMTPAISFEPGLPEEAKSRDVVESPPNVTLLHYKKITINFYCKQQEIAKLSWHFLISWPSGVWPNHQ